MLLEELPSIKRSRIQQCIAAIEQYSRKCIKSFVPFGSISRLPTAVLMGRASAYGQRARCNFRNIWQKYRVRPCHTLPRWFTHFLTQPYWLKWITLIIRGAPMFETPVACYLPGSILPLYALIYVVECSFLGAPHFWLVRPRLAVRCLLSV